MDWDWLDWRSTDMEWEIVGWIEIREGKVRKGKDFRIKSGCKEYGRMIERSRSGWG